MYECLSYAADGTIRRNRQRSVLHGTAFAYQRQANDTLLLTNDHVAAWPSVTDASHLVDGVPAGCKLVSQTLALVDNEHDEYPRDDVPATVVVTDPQLDVAILRAHAPLQVMPWKVGRSADLRERNVVEVRGFPLGAFRATNIGKVISAHDHDDYGDWDHDDFVVDALLSSGNSGSPGAGGVARHRRIRVGGDLPRRVQPGERVERRHRDRPGARPDDHPQAVGPRSLQRTSLPSSGAREKLHAALGPLAELFFPFGGLVANIRAQTGWNRFSSLCSRRTFPSAPIRCSSSERRDRRSADLGAPGRIWVGAPRGLKDYAWAALLPDVQAQLTRALDEMAGDAVAYAELKEAREVDRSRDNRPTTSLAWARPLPEPRRLAAIWCSRSKRSPRSWLLSPARDVVHFAELFVTPANPSESGGNRRQRWPARRGRPGLREEHPRRPRSGDASGGCSRGIQRPDARGEP